MKKQWCLLKSYIFWWDYNQHDKLTRKTFHSLQSHYSPLSRPHPMSNKKALYRDSDIKKVREALIFINHLPYSDIFHKLYYFNVAVIWKGWCNWNFHFTKEENEAQVNALGLSVRETLNACHLESMGTNTYSAYTPVRWPCVPSIWPSIELLAAAEEKALSQ